MEAGLGEDEMKPGLRDIADGALLGGSRLAPTRLMAHWMWLLRQHAEIADRWGHHIRPIHYYEPLPDFRRVKREALERRRQPLAIDFKIADQTERVARLAKERGAELEEIVRNDQFDFRNGFFAGLDAAVYYAIIRDLKPRRCVEIGSGYSTRIATLALERNEAEGCGGELMCVEPYPEARLTQSTARFKLIETLVQDAPLSIFESLEANDILFIDSSHVATTGGDVCFEFLDVLPRLKPGVWIHVHDIFFPCDYPADWVLKRRRAFNEQYVLEAFLSGNRDFEPTLTNYWLALDHREIVERLCPVDVALQDAAEAPSASFWMRRRA
jgi:hypothetical protein